MARVLLRGLQYFIETINLLTLLILLIIISVNKVKLKNSDKQEVLEYITINDKKWLIV